MTCWCICLPCLVYLSPLFLVFGQTGQDAGGGHEKTLAPRFFQRHQRVAKGGADPACTGNAQPSTSFQMVVAQARV